MPTKYDRHRIADELEATASGKAYYGNALYVLLGMPGLDGDQRMVLERWLAGNQQEADVGALLALAAEVRAAGWPTPSAPSKDIVGTVADALAKATPAGEPILRASTYVCMAKAAVAAMSSRDTHPACRWSRNANGGWDTACRNSFEINEGTPAENGIAFCAYCGGRIEVD